MANNRIAKGGKIPGGGRKGGTRFPNLDLKKAVDFSKKLVSKTFTSPQPGEIVYPGVFNSNGPLAKVRASALRQYALLEGDEKGISASQLARDINVSEGAELANNLRKCFLQPKIFRTLFDTFKTDKVTIQRIKQQAQNHGVHADLLESCVGFFVTSLEYCQLGKVGTDGVDFFDLDISLPDDLDAIKDGEDNIDSEDAPAGQIDKSNSAESDLQHDNNNSGFTSASSNVTVNLTLDSTMDSDKLEKQLALLKRYGVLK